ncbi:hypothetical protein [Holdemanella biformis]
MKITAKGMFKRLGYERERILNERFISYRKPYGNSFCYIQFDLKDKTYNAHYFGQKGGCFQQILSPKELVAIYKQIDEFVREACARLDRKIWDLIGFSTRFISMESCLEQITNYIIKLEHENFELKEYKKHQERANERRYRSGEESWHRGSVVAKKK